MPSKIITDFSEPFRKMVGSFAVFMNGAEPSKRGGQVSWMGIELEDGGSIASIPKFCQHSKEMNIVVFDRLPRGWTSL
jgi:hypothetical protein